MTLDTQGAVTRLEICDMAMSILLPLQAVISGDHPRLLETIVTILLVHLLCDVTMMITECEVRLRRRLLRVLTIGLVITHLKKDLLAILLATGSRPLSRVMRTTDMTGGLPLRVTDMQHILQVHLLRDLEVPSVVPFPVAEKNLKGLGMPSSSET